MWNNKTPKYGTLKHDWNRYKRQYNSVNVACSRPTMTAWFNFIKETGSARRHTQAITGKKKD